jgi:hypothetical protein
LVLSAQAGCEKPSIAILGGAMLERGRNHILLNAAFSRWRGG